jgi:hypothetical protein
MKDKELETKFCNKLLHEYSSEQMDAVMEFIEEKFGKGERTDGGWVAHELTSEYVHTDVVITENDDYQHFVTCGMGVRKMPNCMPFGDKAFKRIELFFAGSKERIFTDYEKRVLAGELCRITKYPFRNNTFFGPGHTIDASTQFKELFGYDYFLFYGPFEELSVDGLGDVYFLTLIPIYEAEREWMVNNNSFAWLFAFFNSEDWDLVVDKEREVFIPNEEEMESIDF